jgi:IS30 family transposase
MPTFQQPIMPRRPALQEISSNRPAGHQLRRDTRDQIVGAVKCGATIADVSRTYDLPPSTVSTTVKRSSIRSANDTLSRTGRPQKASKRDIQKLKQYAQLYPKHTYQ